MWAHRLDTQIMVTKGTLGLTPLVPGGVDQAQEAEYTRCAWRGCTMACPTRLSTWEAVAAGRLAHTEPGWWVGLRLTDTYLLTGEGPREVAEGQGCRHLPMWCWRHCNMAKGLEKQGAGWAQPFELDAVAKEYPPPKAKRRLVLDSPSGGISMQEYGEDLLKTDENPAALDDDSDDDVQDAVKKMLATPSP